MTSEKLRQKYLPDCNLSRFRWHVGIIKQNLNQSISCTPQRASGKSSSSLTCIQSSFFSSNKTADWGRVPKQAGWDQCTKIRTKLVSLFNRPSHYPCRKLGKGHVRVRRSACLMEFLVFFLFLFFFAST